MTKKNDEWYNPGLESPKIRVPRKRDSKGRFIKNDSFLESQANLMLSNNLHPKTYVHFNMKGKPTGYSQNMDSLILGLPVVFYILMAPIFLILYPIIFFTYIINDKVEGYPYKKYRIPWVFLLVVWFIIMISL